jgi:hypothetical protein
MLDFCDALWNIFFCFGTTPVPETGAILPELSVCAPCITHKIEAAKVMKYNAFHNWF